MSHLGRKLSALVDGELGDSERDLAHAHLVSCDACREEAAALRALKRRIRALGEAPADSALTRRLMALGGPAEPAAPRPFGTSRSPLGQVPLGWPRQPPAAWGAAPDWFGDPAGGSPLSPAGVGHLSPGRGRGHARYVVAGAIAALAVGLGAASFAAGGGDHQPGPAVTPEVDVYNMQHAVMTGQVPLIQPPTAPTRQTGLSLRP